MGKTGLRSLASRIPRDRKVALRACEPFYQSQVDLFFRSQHSLEGVIAAPEFQPHQNSFELIYRSQTRVMRELRAALHGNESITACPYCQIDSELPALDHFLNIAGFPEFAFYANNLIPACTTCNSSCKGASLVDANGERMFFNPYFDRLNGERFLCCQIAVLGKVEATFSVDVSMLDPYLGGILDRHFIAMDLKTRYARASQRYVRKKLKTLKAAHDSGGAAKVQEILAGEHAKELTDVGPNYWLASFLEAAASTVDFCDQGFIKPFKF